MKMFQCADYDRKTSTSSHKNECFAGDRREELGGLYTAAVSAGSGR